MVHYDAISRTVRAGSLFDVTRSDYGVRVIASILCGEIIMQTAEWIKLATTDTRDWKHDIGCCVAVKLSVVKP